jgi:hypothetical protein
MAALGSPTWDADQDHTHSAALSSRAARLGCSALQFASKNPPVAKPSAGALVDVAQ